MKFKYVYILESKVIKGKYYVGITGDLRGRIKEHNLGKVRHTAKYRPWRIKNAIAFVDGEKAVDFEKYLKSSSGRAFARKHF